MAVSSDNPARPPERDVYSVSRLNREVRTLLERGFGSLWLEAEISNFAKPASGHWYFSLKDASAQVRCAMFRQRNMLATLVPRDGQKVLVRARIGLYEPRGEFQLIIDHIEDAGLGALRRQYEELLAKLAAEGLFEASRKRPLPLLPRRIGVITSPTGAAIRDILQVLARRFAAIPVLIYPVPVQGAQAAGEIIAALELAARRLDCDVLILARGGGSLEDLWAFNDEALARAIARSPIPVISAVGHEVDTTIADFAADVRAPTHRAAQVSPAARLTDQMQRLDELEQRMGRALRQRVSDLRSTFIDARSRLWGASPALLVRDGAARRADLASRLKAAQLALLQQWRERLLPLIRTLQAVSPLATLDRGYAIVSIRGGAILRRAIDAPWGTLIEARLGEGIIVARVEDPSD